ncbi:hypothetical protein Sbal117_1835 [Shewanella baltica OS117]|nr:hypothetical protein Sbal117_1835 [Shewanella baltica OS117]
MLLNSQSQWILSIKNAPSGAFFHCFLRYQCVFYTFLNSNEPLVPPKPKELHRA